MTTITTKKKIIYVTIEGYSNEFIVEHDDKTIFLGVPTTLKDRGRSSIKVREELSKILSDRGLTHEEVRRSIEDVNYLGIEFKTPSDEIKGGKKIDIPLFLSKKFQLDVF